ncbi:hypothetical protein CEV31_1007 [Brucella thiophenivorans]|uniref:Uncharacterized protein n=1 Tax=Brucella thiophenivorans TaxID=571255 RepID=A0A256G0V6_9HYPH|nr:hypothetical protein CEV31_1007 [Brucella thiophenivorans]
MLEALYMAEKPTKCQYRRAIGRMGLRLVDLWITIYSKTVSFLRHIENF